MPTPTRWDMCITEIMHDIMKSDALKLCAASDFSYKEMEETGVMMPVYENKSRYIKPARYDDELTIKVSDAEIAWHKSCI